MIITHVSKSIDGKVTQLQYNSFYANGEKYGYCYGCFGEDDLRLVTNNNNEGEQEMGTITEQLRDQDLDESDQLLVKYGIQNRDGSITDEGIGAVAEALLEQAGPDGVRKAIVDKLKSIEDKEKKKK